MDDTKIKHLEFVRDSIMRMNQNSFHIKGFAIAIDSALLALYASSYNVTYILVGIFPTLLFWLMDAHYFQQERKFKGIYNHIIGLSEDAARIPIREFEMPIQKYRSGNYSYFKAIWSKTVWPLYALIIIELGLGGVIL